MGQELHRTTVGSNYPRARKEFSLPERIWWCNYIRKDVMEITPVKIIHGNPDINEILEEFTRATGIKLMNIKRQRQFASTLLKTQSKEDILMMIHFLATTLDDRYAPRISDIEKLYYKWGDLYTYGRKKASSFKETTRVDLSNL